MTALTQLGQFLMAWYNLPFSLALLVFLGLAALQVIGFGAEGDFGVDGDLDIDADFDADMDADVDGFGQHLAWLGFLGVGEAPITILLLVMSGSFGFIGLLLNQLMRDVMGGYPTWGIVPVLLVTFMGGLMCTSFLGRLLGRAVPALATTATSVKQLVGQQARVISPQITESYGQIKVRDKGGTLITLFAVTDPGKSPISYDEQVLLVEYDDKRKVFVVVAEK